MSVERRFHDSNYELASRDDIRAGQFEKLKRLLDHVSATNDFYRERWRAAGVDLARIKSLADFAAAVPLVEKKDFVDDQANHPPFGSRLRHPLSLGERLEIYTTSGTSGQGVEIHAQTERELHAMEEIYRYHFRWAGLKRGDHIFLTLPITMLGGGRIECQGALGYGLTVYPVGNYDAQRKLDLMRRFKPVAIYGSTSYFGHLAAISSENPPVPGLKSLLTGLEGVGFSYLERLQEQWKAPAADRFGCTQVRADFMFTCEHGIGKLARPGMLHSIDPYVLVEVIDPTTGRQVADGEFGEIVVTSLYHVDNPVVRCRLRDGGIYRPWNYCTCGRPFDGVEVASITRTDDVKKVKGINIFPQAVDDLMFGFPEVDEYQVVLSTSADHSDIATLLVMPKTPIWGLSREAFVKNVGEKLREKTGIRFAVQLADNIERSEYKARRWRDERIR